MALIGAGADVNCARQRNGWSGLHYAAWYDHQDLLELLLEQPDVNVNSKDINNLTPLMMACAKGNEKIVRRLCQVPGIDLCCKGRVHLLLYCNLMD